MLQGKFPLASFITKLIMCRYGIAPRLLEPGSKPRIEVFNPCDDADDQKTSTAILFTDQGEFIAFGTTAL